MTIACLGSGVWGGNLMANYGFDVAPAVHNVEDSYVVSLPTINHNVTAGMDTPQALAKVVTAAARVWIF